MKDRFNREVTYLRIAVNRDCNLRCFFCHREGTPQRGGRALAAQEFARLAAVAAGLGFSRIKITGGEPLARPDIVEIAAGVAGTVDEVSMVSNATLLTPQLAGRLKGAGVQRMNISLHSLSPERYAAITGHRRLKAALAGIRAAKGAGMDPIKINAVILRGVNEDDVGPMTDLCAREDMVLQLIELHGPRSVGETPFFRKYHLDLGYMEASLAARAAEVVERRLHRRKVYRVPAASGEAWVEVVRPMNNPEFCANCMKLRLTPAGYLKPCLLSNNRLVDILTPLRAGATDAELRELFLQAVMCKEPYFTPDGEAVRPVPERA